MFRKIFNKKTLPWWIAAVLALALILSVTRRPGSQVAMTGAAKSGASGRKILYWADPMFAQGPPHLYKSDKPGVAPDCQMKLVPVYADESPVTTGSESASNVAGYSSVSLPPERQQLIGVKLAKAQLRSLVRSASTVGRVEVAENRRAEIHAKFEGFVERLYVDFTGKSVRRGDPLLSIYSPELLATQQELILAVRHRKQLGNMIYEAARRRLLLWDMSAGDIAQVERSGQPMRSITLRSPVDGVVITKNVLLGNRVMPADPLYVIADLRRVWVVADVYESELAGVRQGQSALITVSALPGRTWPARVTFVSPILEGETRTVKVRLELDNADGALKPDMFTNVALGSMTGAVLSVPDSAVMKTGTRNVVFVAEGNGRFQPRLVGTGTQVEGFIEIRSGLREGETVVAEANFLVDSESRLKSAFGQMDGAGMAGMDMGPKP